MPIKLFRVFVHNRYVASATVLSELKVVTIPCGFSFISILNQQQGLGLIKGTTKKIGQNYSPVPVCCFKRSTRELLWETKSKSDGTYFFRNIAVNLECFIVAFDPNEQYNAVIQDKIVAKDGRNYG